jgi:hypothetical protein
MYQVLKPIPMGDEIIPTGTIVDGVGWRNLKALINGRYLLPVLQNQPVDAIVEEKPKPVKKASAPK